MVEVVTQSTNDHHQGIYRFETRLDITFTNEREKSLGSIKSVTKIMIRNVFLIKMLNSEKKFDNVLFRDSKSVH